MVIERIPTEMVDREHRDHARVVYTSDPLHRLRRQGTITGRQRRAGELLREMWDKAGREPSITAGYQEQIGQGSIASAYVVGIDYHQQFITLMRKFTPTVQAALMALVMQERLPRNRVRYAVLGLTKLQHIFRT